MALVGALGDTPALCGMPAGRLLADLVAAADRNRSGLESLGDAAGGALPARWYRDVQVAALRHSGKARTVEFSGLSVLRLCQLFPTAQFVVVRQLKRAIPRSRRLPPLAEERILQVGSAGAATAETVGRVLAFLGETGPNTELDLSDERIRPTSVLPA
jgi:hypothetical protein